MGEKSMKHNEVKKKKKTEVKASDPVTFMREAVTQPELITKKKKER